MKNLKICIKSTGIYLPKQIVKSDDLFEDIKSDVMYGIPINWMSQDMGIIERRMASECAKPSELAIKAAEQALSNQTDIKPDDINMVIFCGIERDHPEPATAHIINSRLGLKANNVFDVSNACFGFMDGMEIASSFIKSGAAKNALIVTGEVPTKLIHSFSKKLKSGVDLKIAKNLIGFLSVGDAGGAMIVGGETVNNDVGFDFFSNRVDSSHYEKCYYNHSDDGGIEGQMMMAKMVAYGYKMHKSMLPESLKKIGGKGLNWLLSHQTGKRCFDQIANLNLVNRDKMIKTYDSLGNITSATFPVNFHRLLNSKKLSSGDKIGGFFAGSGLTTGQFSYTC